MIYSFEKLEFRPISVGNFVHKDGLFNVDARPYAAVSYRKRGTAEFEIGEKRILVKPGNILFIPADTAYKVEYSSSESIVAHLNDCNYFEAENLSLKNNPPIENRFQKLLACWNERHSVNQAKSIIYDILELMSEDKKSDIGNTTFRDCVSYINSHYFDPELDISKVCERGFISVSSLQRKFLEHFETSPKQYLIKLRMNKALELLISDELSIREIAICCGFSDEKYFSRAFKKQYGYPPSQMKNHILI